MTQNSSPLAAEGQSKRTPKPILEGHRSTSAQISVYALTIIPFIALIIAVPVAWGWGLSWLDVILFVVLYNISGLGITVGFHRYFTHGSFKAVKPLRIAMAMAGQMALQGSVITWVADHRRHHAFSDREGDPHSPWLYGESVPALIKGFWHAHMGWIFERDTTNQKRFAPDLLADKSLRKVDDLFWLGTVVSMLLPPLIGGLVTMSWWGAATAFFWASLVRVSLLHHVTWSVNSICHMFGDQPFSTRDKAGNFWPLALLSFGESWHNMHHADPTSARHGALKGQLDISARVIWIFEKFGWVSMAKWPTTERLERLSVKAGGTQAAAATPGVI